MRNSFGVAVVDDDEDMRRLVKDILQAVDDSVMLILYQWG
jgi:FixJ family two-component response regulator